VLSFAWVVLPQSVGHREKHRESHQRRQNHQQYASSYAHINPILHNKSHWQIITSGSWILEGGTRIHNWYRAIFGKVKPKYKK
jgi:hypothetical protein